MGVIVIRLKLNGSAVGGQRLLVLTRMTQNVTEVVVGLGVVRLGAMALRKAASASFGFFKSCSTVPRPIWA